MDPGRFLTLEGGEGAGKTTQQRLILEFLKNRGITAIQSREPGGSQGAEQIRGLLVNGDTERWDGLTETLLFYAARRDHVLRVIEPALKRGDWIVCDRFSDSTRAYQMAGRGVEAALIERIHDIAIGNFRPDLTLLLDLPVQAGLNRALGRGDSENRYENMDRAFHGRLRQAFLDIAAAEPNRCMVVDADRPADQVFESIREILCSRFPFLQ